MKYKICSICVCDSSIESLILDIHSVCQYCKIHNEMEMEYPLDNNSWNSMMHQSLINGSDMKIENDYVEHLDNQFSLSRRISINKFGNH